MISDIYSISRNLTALDVPKPQAVLYTLCGIKHGGTADPLFQGVRVWTDTGDVCESESFGKYPNDQYRPVIMMYSQMDTVKASLNIRSIF